MPRSILHRLRSALLTAEDWLGMFFGALLTLMLAGLLGLMWEDQFTRGPARWITTVLFVGWVVLDLPYVIRLFVVALGRWKPLALEVARRQWVAPFVFRVPIAIWWAAHFAGGVCFAILGEGLDKAGDPRGVRAMAFLMSASYGLAANGYLMLAVGAITCSERVRQAVWRHRVLIDCAVGVLGALLPRWSLR
jgi:hypothetical protein